VRFANILVVVLVGALTFGASVAHADPKRLTAAARLSAALGGSLDSDIGEAGALDRPVDESSIMRRPGRSDEYRRRVVFEMHRLAATR
jgi:hypothetical protein